VSARPSSRSLWWKAGLLFNVVAAFAVIPLGLLLEYIDEKIQDTRRW
jgi:hypothetical protein